MDAPSRVYGVGALHAGVTEWVPAMFVLSAAFEDSEPWSVHSVTDAAALIDMIGVEIEKDTALVTLPMPWEQLSPGTRALTQNSYSTLGPHVDVAGVAAITTAGHALQQVGAPVHEPNGTLIGNVIWTDDLSKHNPGHRCADIALVEIAPGMTVSGGPTITGTGKAAGHDAIVAHRATGATNAWVRGVAVSFARAANVGSWGDVLITDTAISAPGDSGAPVLVDDGSAAIVAHVVGGHQTVYSLVQDTAFLQTEAGFQVVPST